MKLGEIKIEALRLMFAGNLGYKLTADNLTNLITDDNYNVYLYGMIGAINRCLADIEAKKVLPVKVAKVTANEMNGNTLDLTKIPDYSSLCAVTHRDGVYEEMFVKRGNQLSLPKIQSNDDYYEVYYYPRLERITDNTDNTAELVGVPDEIARLIPYYIKGEVYREDDPNEAGEARNWYEYGLEAYIQKEAPSQTAIVSWYSMI